MNLHGIWIYINLLLQILFILFFFIPKPVIQLCQTTDAATMDAIEKWAADEFRSTNGQLQWIIAEALRKSGRMKKSKNPPPSEEKAKED